MHPWLWCHPWAGTEACYRFGATFTGNVMPTERCEEQARLALAAVAAKNRVYDTKTALESAKKQKLDIEPHELALHDAREAEWHAIAALENHKKQHKCWGIGLPRPTS
jgi:hypothetical protein